MGRVELDVSLCVNDLCDLCTTKIGASVPSFELALTLFKPRQVNSGVKKGQDKKIGLALQINTCYVTSGRIKYRYLFMWAPNRGPRMALFVAIEGLDASSANQIVSFRFVQKFKL